MISRAIAACRATGKYVGICGQGPSDHPDFADWLADEGIVSISLNPDTVVETWQRLAKRADAPLAYNRRLSPCRTDRQTLRAASLPGTHKELPCVTMRSFS